MNEVAMSDSLGMPHHGKISVALATRLAQLSPRQKLRTIIVLQTGHLGRHAGKNRPTGEERQDEMYKSRLASSRVMEDIDGILERFDGRRLSQPTALGTIVVESTPPGIAALCASEYVKAILQDQPLSRAL
jgi:hypothetical protein